MVLPVNSSGNKDYNNFEIYEKVSVALHIASDDIEFFLYQAYRHAYTYRTGNSISRNGTIVAFYRCHLL